jgi:hypothetical protein
MSQQLVAQAALGREQDLEDKVHISSSCTWVTGNSRLL